MKKMKKHPIVKKIVNVLKDTGFSGTYLHDVVQEDQTLKVNVKLPPHIEQEDLECLLPNLKQELSANDVKFGKTNGKFIQILFGMNELKKIFVTCENIETFVKKNSLKITFPSAFGESVLDLEDGASCHVLNGGTTRMGKTCLMLYLCTLLVLQTKGKMKLYITSSKLKDFYPFQGLKNVYMSKAHEDVETMLDQIMMEYKKRDYLLYSEALLKATDAKSVKKIYPDKYYLFRPIFLVIDEYARFADNQAIQRKVMELVETAGYVNIHVIITSQRPDARTVLPARIKANLLARICFTTTDKNNSIVILDQEGAESLGRIEGRALYLDGEMNVIQVPYLDALTCESLLKPFKEGVKFEKNQTRSNDTRLAEKIQNLFQESNSLLNLQEEYKSDQCMQSSHEKTLNGWFRLGDSKDKR